MRKMILSIVVLSVFLIFVLGCAKQVSEKTVDTGNTVPASGAAVSTASTEEQEISASADDLADLDALSKETDTDVNFDDLEELTK